MFYSQLLLSKKGALGVVWMAAHCHKRLRKEQVQQTNISTSVDKILQDEVHVVTHRILAFLLLGVVRIYSKKVDYLFRDSHDIVNRLCGFKTTGKTTQVGIGGSRGNYLSISLPKRFELDAFDLELSEDQDSRGVNTRSREKIMHAGGRLKLGSKRGLLQKENISFLGACSTSHTAASKDVFSTPSHDTNISIPSLEIVQMQDKTFNDDGWENSEGPTNDMECEDSYDSPSPNNRSLEILRGAMFSLDDRMDPMVLDEAEREEMNAGRNNDNQMIIFQEQNHDVEFDPSVASTSHHRSDFSLPSLGTLQISGFSLEHTPGFKMYSDKPSDKDNVEHVRARLNFEEDEPRGSTGEHSTPIITPQLKIPEAGVGTPEVAAMEMSSEAEKGINGGDKPSDEPHDVATKKVISPESSKGHTTVEHPMPVIITPEIKIPESSVGTPEVAPIITPAPIESMKTPKKRKAVLLDTTTVVSTRVYKHWLDNRKDLIRKKKKVPHTDLQAWRARKLAHLPQSFFEPSIPGISVDLGEKIRTVVVEPVTSSAGQDDVIRSPVVTLEDGDRIPDVGSPVVAHEDRDRIPAVGSPDQMPIIAPGTPVVTQVDSLRSLETGGLADSDVVEPTSSLESIRNRTSLNEGLELDAMFQEETNSFEEDSQRKDSHSARTRMTGKYLCQKFLDKKGKNEEEVLNLSGLLAGKTKKESARMFYEILVLKTRDCIDVKQENAYDDILLRETSKLNQDL